MAEFRMKQLVREKGLEDSFYIESAATSTEEIGNGVYPPVRRLLASHGISCTGKTARQLTRSDYARFDYFIGMDSMNMRSMLRMLGGDPDGKCSLLMDWTDRPGSVPDPWYTDDFETTWEDVSLGCRCLLEKLT